MQEEIENKEGETTEVQTTKVITDAKTGFSFKNPTPLWATWMFRTQFILNKMAIFYLSGTDTIPSSKMKHIMLIMAVIDLGTWTLAKSLGVKKNDLGLSDENL